MTFIPKLFIDGSEYKIIITDRACSDLCSSNQLPENELSYKKVKWIHELDSVKMIANMFRYANGQSLKMPQLLNDEPHPFWAFKLKTPPKKETFDEFRQRLSVDPSVANDMVHLRSYFWYEDNYLTPDYQEENLILISHFAIKTTPTMTAENVTICRNQKHKFDTMGKKYA